MYWIDYFFPSEKKQELYLSNLQANISISDLGIITLFLLLLNKSLLQMNKIPSHNISEILQDKLIFTGSFENVQIDSVDYAHRDNYYVFVFLEDGTLDFSIDFHDYCFDGGSIFCLLPGQVHHYHDNKNAIGYFLIVDPSLVDEEYINIFQQGFHRANNIKLSEEMKKDLKYFIEILQRRIESAKNTVEQNICHSLLSLCIGIFAEAYQLRLPLACNKRYVDILLKFNNLLSLNYKTIKRPSQYAALLNISPIYLNEVIKNMTGISVGKSIQREITIHAQFYVIQP